MSGSTQPPRIAVVGAGSLIGEALLQELRARKFPHSELHALEDARDLGRKVEAEEAELTVGDVAAFDFSRVDLAFFCARASVAERYAEHAASHGWAIDLSGAHRSRDDVPLVVADVNPGVLGAIGRRGLIALPGSASVALATVLAPLDRLAGLQRVEVATYQAVSGSGRAAMERLAAQTVDLLSGRTPKSRGGGTQIAFNVIPQVDALQADGSTLEEQRLSQETRRLLDLPQLAVNVTAVRVPVFFGHSFVVHAAFERKVDAAAATLMLQSSNGISLLDPADPVPYPTPATAAAAPDQVYVGRLRADSSRDRGLNFWVVADNVRKCAAYNAFSVAQILVNRLQ